MKHATRFFLFFISWSTEHTWILAIYISSAYYKQIDEQTKKKRTPTYNAHRREPYVQSVGVRSEEKSIMMNKILLSMTESIWKKMFKKGTDRPTTYNIVFKKRHAVNKISMLKTIKNHFIQKWGQNICYLPVTFTPLSYYFKPQK